MKTNGITGTWRMAAAAVIGLLVAVLLASTELPRLFGSRGESYATASQVRPSGQDYSSGAYLYRTFCASCHGATGRGDGPVTDMLQRRPPDLTTISSRHGGTFPRGDIYSSIDGRRSVAGHGSREMPVWGDVLRATEGHDDVIIKRRIDALVMHLESLQK